MASARTFKTGAAGAAAEGAFATAIARAAGAIVNAIRRSGTMLARTTITAAHLSRSRALVLASCRRAALSNARPNPSATAGQAWRGAGLARGTAPSLDVLA